MSQLTKSRSLSDVLSLSESPTMSLLSYCVKVDIIDIIDDIDIRDALFNGVMPFRPFRPFGPLIVATLLLLQ